MITILGATGFVGSALSRRLQNLGEIVVNLSRPDFELTRPDTFRTIPSETDILIHAAGHVGSAAKDEILWQTNVESTYYLVQYLNADCRPRLVVYLSSGAVYGFQPQTIDGATPLRPDSLYGLSKLLAERILETMLDAKVVTLRLFFPFGPGQKTTRLIPSLTQRIMQGQPVELNTPLGLPMINPIYINDLVVQIIHILHEPSRACYNLGGERAYSIKQIAEAIARTLNTTPRFLTVEREVGNMMCKPDLPGADPEAFGEQIAWTVNSFFADSGA